MKHNSIIRSGLTMLSILLISVFAVNAFAALNAYLKLKRADGKTYTSQIDSKGKFSFDNVEPGTYDLLFVLDGTRSQDDGTIQSIEISSFSWGASNTAGKQGKSTPVTRSNISNNRTASRTATVDAAPPSVMCNGKKVATGDLDGDGVPDQISSPVIWSPKSNIYSTLLDVIFHELTVAQTATVEGAIKGSWNLKENVK